MRRPQGGDRCQVHPDPMFPKASPVISRKIPGNLGPPPAILPGKSPPVKIPGKTQEHPNPKTLPDIPGKFLGIQENVILPGDLLEILYSAESGKISEKFLNNPGQFPGKSWAHLGNCWDMHAPRFPGKIRAPKNPGNPRGNLGGKALGISSRGKNWGIPGKSRGNSWKPPG